MKYKDFTEEWCKHCIGSDKCDKLPEEKHPRTHRPYHNDNGEEYSYCLGYQYDDTCYGIVDNFGTYQKDENKNVLLWKSKEQAQEARDSLVKFMDESLGLGSWDNSIHIQKCSEYMHFKKKFMDKGADDE